MDIIDLRKEAQEIVEAFKNGGTKTENVKRVTIKVELLDGTTIEKVIEP